MTGRHIAVDEDGQLVRPPTGPDSLVDPTGPEPDGVTLLWDADPPTMCCEWLARLGVGWAWTSDPAEPLICPVPWEAIEWGVDRREPASAPDHLIVARTVTDDGTRPPGRHHPDGRAARTGQALCACGQTCSERTWCRCCREAWSRGHLAVGIDPTEPTPVTCDDCHGDGCENCRGHGVHVDEIAENDITPAADIEDAAAYGDVEELRARESTAYRAGALAILAALNGRACRSPYGWNDGSVDAMDALRADIEAGRWPA